MMTEDTKQAKDGQAKGEQAKGEQAKDGQAKSGQAGAGQAAAGGLRVLHYGDCLDILTEMADESVDLIYLDPPFNSKANYNMLFGSEKGDDQAQIQAFSDTWYWRADHEEVYSRLTIGGGTMGETAEALMVILGRSGMLAYLLFMMERLIELKRVLGKTGSIYLHCDPTASHYLKIVMDAVFGSKMFRNEVIWCYREAINAKTRWNRKHDVILFYTRSDEWVFKADEVLDPHSEETIKKYKYKDKKGSYRLMGRGLKGSPIRSARDVAPHWEEKHPELTYRQYLRKGSYPVDYWMIDVINQNAKERLGYPTQKPLALLDRIIKASSNEGDVVLDPFCGCGTTVDAAEALGRRWIGIDISTLAINVILDRLQGVHGKAVAHAIEVMGTPRDVPGAQKLFTRSPFEFERWAVGLLRGRPNDKQTGDGGSDGTLRFPSRDKYRPQRGVISVKGGKNLVPAMVRSLHGTIEKDRAQIGILLTLHAPSPGMIDTANTYGLWEDAFTGAKFPRIQIITIEDLLEGKTPRMPTPLSPYVRAEYAHAQQQEMSSLLG